MAVHNFNYTYTFDSISTMPLSQNDDTQIVKNVCVEVSAVDQADNTQTMTEKMYSSLDGVYSIQDNGLPSNFILVENLTNAKVIEWYKNTVTEDDLDVYFTWQIYGADEVSPIVE